jgi:peptide/nickel transport system permease protein
MRFSIRGSATDEQPLIGGSQPNGDGDAEEVVPAGTGTGLVADVPAEGGDVYTSGSPFVLVARTFAQNKLAIIGIAIVVVLILFSFIGPLIYSTNQNIPNLALVNCTPGGAHLLGCDDNGYDILGRLMEGGQSSVEVGLATGVIATLVGLIYGAISGFFGGILDSVLMRIVDIGLAIPIIFLFIFMSEIFKPNLVLLIILLALVSWQIPARIVRGETLTIRTREYVQAARGMGSRSPRIILRHIVPNTIGTIMVTVTFQVANAILVLAVLQYLGFGLPPSVPTWGGMLSDGTTDLASGYWWQVYPALIAIVLAVLAFNFIGDALQDSFDVRLQER